MDQRRVGFLRRSTGAALSLTLFSLSTLAASPAADFGEHRLAAEAVVTVNAEPLLCQSVLADVRATLETTEAVPKLSSVTGAGGAILSWEPAFDASTGSEADQGDAAGSAQIGRVDADLEGTGRKQVIIYRDDLFTPDRHMQYAYVFPSVAAFDAVKDTVRKEWITAPDNDPDPKKLEAGAQVYYPGALAQTGGTVSTGDKWYPHILFTWHGRYYFSSGTSEFAQVNPKPIQIFRLRASGQVEESCRIEQPALQAAYKKFQSSPGVGSFLNSIRSIGRGGGSCGTLDSGGFHDAQALAAERRAAIRPWAVSIAEPNKGSQPWYDFGPRTEAFLLDWSLEDAWARREYQAYLEQLGPAQEGIAAYLTTEFGVTSTQADSRATQVLHALIGSRLLIASDYSAGHSDGPVLTRLVLLRKRTELEAALTQGEAAYKKARGPDDPPTLAAMISATLENAVEWPYGLGRLLQAQANPNQPNWFGKTPLMTAAHLNRPDTIRVLLHAGANVNATTVEVPRSEACEHDSYKGPRSGRTALMYAAENASPIVMKLLLDAGADPGAKDQEGHGMDFYLAHNPRLTTEERSLGVRGLAAAAERFQGPSFQCDQAHSSAEKAICGSEVLRIFDAELARAYGQFRARNGAAAVAEQRAWLARRDQTCAAPNTDDHAGEYSDCLAEALRTRVRYLHDRLEE